MKAGFTNSEIFFERVARLCKIAWRAGNAKIVIRMWAASGQWYNVFKVNFPRFQFSGTKIASASISLDDRSPVNRPNNGSLLSRPPSVGLFGMGVRMLFSPFPICLRSAFSCALPISAGGFSPLIIRSFMREQSLLPLFGAFVCYALSFYSSLALPVSGLLSVFNKVVAIPLIPSTSVALVSTGLLFVSLAASKVNLAMMLFAVFCRTRVASTLIMRPAWSYVSQIELNYGLNLTTATTFLGSLFFRREETKLDASHDVNLQSRFTNWLGSFSRLRDCSSRLYFNTTAERMSLSFT